MNIAFRADASNKIGSGHVMRCLALADELRRAGHQCLFVCREHTGNLGKLITDKGYILVLLPSLRDEVTRSANSRLKQYDEWLGVPWDEDARQTKEAVARYDLDWLVVDHYALDAKWERAIYDTCKKVMVIDDLANRSHECDLLLDQNLGRSEDHSQSLVPVRCLSLVGPRFALLRPEFASLRRQSLERRARPVLKRILISLGGGDQANVTAQLLDGLSVSALPTTTELDIVMGASAPFLEEIRSKAEALPFAATVSVNVTDMAERMHLADLSIGAAGGTSWERCCMGVPSIIVVLAENQRAGAEALVAANTALCLDGNDIAAELAERIGQLIPNTERITSLSLNAAQVCDGKGAIRVANLLAEK